jgi:hypothetical protein
MNNEKKEVEVQIVHHMFKTIPFGMSFNHEIHEMFGIDGVDDKRTIVEVSSNFFDSVTKDEVITPSLKDFMAAADDEEKFENLGAAVISTEEREKSKDTHGNPIPAFVPHIAVVIPIFLVSLFGQ